MGAQAKNRIIYILDTDIGDGPNIIWSLFDVNETSELK